jgi:hypothetical protein
MATAQPLPIDRSELEVAVDKIRAGQPLTKRERAIVNERGMELLADDLTDEPPPGAEPIETTPEEEEALLEDEVVAEANRLQGVRGITATELFERLRAVG